MSNTAQKLDSKGMHKATNPLGPIVGRCMIALIFLLSAIIKIGHFSETVAKMMEKGIPMAEILLVISIVIELGSSVLIIIGWKARIAAAALLVWMIPVTLLYHNFWAMTGYEQFINRIMFLKNIALMGAMLYIMTFGSGRYSAENMCNCQCAKNQCAKKGAD